MQEKCNPNDHRDLDKAGVHMTVHVYLTDYIILLYLFVLFTHITGGRGSLIFLALTICKDDGMNQQHFKFFLPFVTFTIVDVPPSPLFQST